VEAVRSDGSKVRRNLNGSGGFLSELDVATITLLPTAEQVLVDYAVHMRSTLPLNRVSASQRWFAIDPLCYDIHPPGSYSLVSDSYLGMEYVSGIETRKYMNDGKGLRRTEFRAPTLNCFVIRSVNELKGAAGEIEQVTEQEATVMIGPPDEKLFAIPPDFKEAKPSDLLKARMRRDGEEEPIALHLLKSWERQDEVYLKVRSPE
jgi:hypothetical protein